MKRLITTLVPCMLMAVCVSAQGFYDDDIYYDANKAKKEKQEKALAKAREAARSNYVPSQQPFTDYPAADTYTVNSGSTRDVDEYNRRYTIDKNGREQTDSISLDQLTAGDFANTRRIERFSNPDIVAGSNDEDLKYYYYNTEAEPASNTTIVINTVDPWYYGSYNPWYYGGYYNPWYYGYYSPSWSWSWGYNPWYYNPGWGPSWSWSWGWGGGWHHPHPGYWPGHGPSWGWAGSSWRPSSPGASRPHPVGGVNTTPGRRPNGNSYYAPSTTGSRRPASTGTNVSTAGRRPSNVSNSTPAGNRGTSTINNSSTSGNRGTSTIPGSRVGRNNSNNNNSSSSPSSWGAGSRNNGSSSWGSGSRSSGGGSFGGGGGGGRSTGGGRSGRH